MFADQSGYFVNVTAYPNSPNYSDMKCMDTGAVRRMLILPSGLKKSPNSGDLRS